MGIVESLCGGLIVHNSGNAPCAFLAYLRNLVLFALRLLYGFGFILNGNGTHRAYEVKHPGELQFRVVKAYLHRKRAHIVIPHPLGEGKKVVLHFFFVFHKGNWKMLALNVLTQFFPYGR